MAWVNFHTEIKVTLNTATFRHSDKTKSRLIASRLKQWTVVEKCVIV